MLLPDLVRRFTRPGVVGHEEFRIDQERMNGSGLDPVESGMARRAQQNERTVVGSLGSQLLLQIERDLLEMNDGRSPR